MLLVTFILLYWYIDVISNVWSNDKIIFLIDAVATIVKKITALVAYSMNILYDIFQVDEAIIIL